MKRLTSFVDVFVVSGFVTSFFYGFLNPIYVSVILSRLDVRVIAVGSFMSSAFPILIGVALGRRRVFDALYKVLPAVMLAELVMAAASTLVAAVDLMAYYLFTMFILGVFSTSVVYLLQKAKEVRYRRNRAAFDRRMEMADALGSLSGSTVCVLGVVELRDPIVIAALAATQTVISYGLFLLLYRKVPAMRRKKADEDPHPWRFDDHLTATALSAA
jgi:hypothetical protein